MGSYSLQALRATLVAVLLALAPGTLQAQPAPEPLFPDLWCNVGGPTSPQWVACSGAWSGNNTGSSDQLLRVWNLIQEEENWYHRTSESEFNDVYAEVKGWETLLESDPDLSFEDFYLGTTDLGKDEGPFLPFNNGSAGILNIRNPYLGVFVLILKGGNYFNMYLLDLRGLPMVSEIAYDMGSFLDLSHASLWGGPRATVPEPSSLLLLGSGLLGLGFVGYRRRRK